MNHDAVNTMGHGPHPFASNGDQLLARHVRQCSAPKGWSVYLERAAWHVHACFGHRFATCVVTGLAVVLVSSAML